MYKSILVPLDGSPLAEAALPFAQWLAERSGASLTLVRAAHARRSVGDTPPEQQRTVAEAEVYLTALADELVAHGFRVQSGVPYGGSAAACIVEEVSMRHADIVVMATRERSGPDRWLHGSVAEGVVSRAGAPVLLIRVPCSPDAVERFCDQRPVLVVPLDGSSLAEAALPGATNMAITLGGHILLVGVVPTLGRRVAVVGGGVTYAGSKHSQLANDTRGYLAEIANRLTNTGLSAETVLREGEPAPAIAEAAAAYAAAVVVMATYGLTGAARSIMGSVAGEVLHRTSGPVVLIGSAEPRRAEEPVPSQTLSSAAPA
jgi:nucleotide-binding universal stress UspA family protein